MAKTHPPIIPSFDVLLHGGDYNPDQWLHRPDIIQEDYRLMRLAGCNTFSVGIFSWCNYEPSEGQYEFGWLDRTMDNLAEQGSKVFLATPTGGKPAWMARKYPEIRRVAYDGNREPQGRRHNHCITSPVFREKATAINERLAKRYAGHAALGGWHISNEYGGECYCELCIAKFRRWLEERHGDLDHLNRHWWADFWGHRFTDFAEIDPRDESIDGLALDWKRFVTWNTVDFMKAEVAAVRRHSDLLVTTNLMQFYPGHDSARLAEVCDFVTHDNYPFWHNPDTRRVLQTAAMTHDYHRGLKGKPFLLIESSPGIATWQSQMRQKSHGQHRLQMLQAIGHGSEGAMYFQWRKGQGGIEKFHGAVVDHEGSDNSRVFQGVAEVGEILKKITNVRGGEVSARAAVLYDYEARWALETSAGPISADAKRYTETCLDFNAPLWDASIAVDVVESTVDFAGYELIIAPQLFLLKAGVASRLKEFVERGGSLLVTALSGVVNEHNLCFLGGQPGDGLRELLGLWVEETNEFEETSPVTMSANSGNTLQLSGSFAMDTCVDLVHTEGAEALASFADGQYAGAPALTVNHVGDGAAYYLAGRGKRATIEAVVSALLAKAGLKSPFPGKLSDGVVAHLRENAAGKFFFLLNSTDQSEVVGLDAHFEDLIDERRAAGELTLPPFGSAVLRLV